MEILNRAKTKSKDQNHPNRSEECLRPAFDGNNRGDNHGKKRKNYLHTEMMIKITNDNSETTYRSREGLYSAGIKQARVLNLTKN